MKNKVLLGILWGITIICTACKTPIVVTPTEIANHVQTQAKMDFVGFKNINRRNALIHNFGTILEQNNIALDKQTVFFNDLNAQGLDDYKSVNRYITFVQVERHIYHQSDDVADNFDMNLSGWLIAGLTCFALVPVYVPLLCCSDRNECEISLKCDYRIYVYDKVKHEIVIAEPVKIDVCDHYKGQYGHKETNKRSVDQYYMNILQNQLLETYVNVSEQVAQLK